MSSWLRSRSWRCRPARRDDAPAIAELERDGYAPELWPVVRDGDEIVAATVCLAERLGAGWVARVFTRRPWRGRGIGEALVRQAFSDFWARGRPIVGLGVAAQSTTGANRLYERRGMHVHWGAVVFEKQHLFEKHLFEKDIVSEQERA